MKEEVLRMEHVYVKRHGKYVLSDFKLNVYKGELVVLFGFSGSGIHELGDVLCGERELERGRILLDEKELNMKRYFYPEQHGIFIVHNENNLVPDLSVAENLFFGGKKRLFSVVVSEKKQERQAKKILEKFQLNIDVRQKAKNLVYYDEIAIRLIKAYVRGAKLVVINEIMELAYIRGGAKILEIIELLKQEGISVLWINQRIEMVKDAAERIVVLRGGRNVKTFYKKNYPMNRLLRAATDSQIQEMAKRPKGIGEDTIFELKHIDSRYLKDVSLQIKEKQITGIWANEPLSLADLRSIVSGEKQNYEGTMMQKEKVYQPRDYEAAVKCGIQYIDIMWYEKHCVPNLSVLDNLMLQNYWLQKKMFSAVNQKWCNYMALKYQQRHPDWPKDRWDSLNPDQQRLLLYEKCLEQPGKLYFVSEGFTRINYKMSEQVMELFQQMLDKDKTLVLLSLNFQDLSRVCEEIYLIQDGNIARKLKKEEFDQIDIWNYVS